MRTLKIIGIAAVAAVAMSIAVVMPASASLFLASIAGALLTDVNLGNHEFSTDNGIVSCTKLTSHSTAKAVRGLTQVEKVKYSVCTAFGTSVTISEAEYEFNADESVSLLNTVIIKSGTGNCTVKVSPFGNQGLQKVLYLPDGTNLIIKAEVTGILYLASGGICGSTGELHNGTYKGEALVVLTGGTLAWHK